MVLGTPCVSHGVLTLTKLTKHQPQPRYFKFKTSSSMISTHQTLYNFIAVHSGRPSDPEAESLSFFHSVGDIRFRLPLCCFQF